jgi:dTDP-4-dehydrorhamnose 3,5-epimerase
MDIMANSKIFGKYISVFLSTKNKNIIFILKDFAYGFQVLNKKTEVVYLIDVVYMPEFNTEIVWDDEDLKINWPIKEPIVFKKDKNLLE